MDLFLNFEWFGPVTGVFFKLKSALRRWQQWEETRVFTDFSQIPHQWWGQSLQTSVFTSHWQTAPALLLHSCSVPFEVYHHVTAAWHTAQDAEELKYSNTSYFMSSCQPEIKNYAFNLSCQRPQGFVNKDAGISYVRIYLIYAVVLQKISINLN